ncbi:MAG: hypothetical protein LH616_04475, partial [Ilumatobacteraceae bacterium]|nr:hypothetical protein [Ilumatobacteraceae bacterium]
RGGAQNLHAEVAAHRGARPATHHTGEGAGVVVTRVGVNFMIESAEGGAVTGLEPYLGQTAHLVAVRQGDLAYTHLHPSSDMSGMFMFGDGISEPGTYRMFLQFGRNGEVLTVPFTVVVP